MRAAKGTKGAKRDGGDRNTITNTSNRDDDALIGADIAAASFDPRDDTDADGLYGGMGSVNDGLDGLTDPDDTEVHGVHASHDLMAEVEADLQHIADCLMVDTLDLEVPGIASVDDSELKRAFGQFDEEGSLKEDTDWRKGSLKSPTGKQSLRVRHVKKTKCLHLEGSNAINAQAHNVVSSGDVTEQEIIALVTAMLGAMRSAAQVVSYEIAAGMEHVFTLFPRLRDRADQRAGTMSGGEQQMLAIGRALMSKPRLLLLDEPTLGLAPLIIAQIFEIIQAIRAAGVTVFLVEQNANRALQIADRGYVLENGRLVLEDTGANLLKNDDVRKAYLGH